MEHPVIIDSKGITQIDDSISRYISSPRGRAALASSMAAPLRRSLNYGSIARQAISIQPMAMPSGAIFYHDYSYNKKDDWEEVKEDIKPGYQHDAIVISSQGKTDTRTNYIMGQRVIIPQFQIFQNPTVKLSDIKRRRFSLLDRHVQTARQQIMAAEDANIFNMLDNLAAIPKMPDKCGNDFYCDGCGEPKYKCYCENVCASCGKKEYDCISESDTGECPKKSTNYQPLITVDSITENEDGSKYNK